MRMNYEPKHSRDHAGSEYVSHVRGDRKEPSFPVTNRFTDKRRDTQLYALVRTYRVKVVNAAVRQLR